MMYDDFIAKFSNVDVSNWGLWSTTYQCFYNAEYGVNSCDDNIILFLLAHLLTMPDDNRQILSQSARGVSVSYAQSSDNQSFFQSTKYGQIYLALLTKNQCGALWI